MGISRDSYHKRRATCGKKAYIHKKRKYEFGRPAPNTKIGASLIQFVRTSGGNRKFRALRLDSGNFAWASKGRARKARVIDVVHNASKRAGPYQVAGEECHHRDRCCSVPPVVREPAGEEDVLAKKRSKHLLKKYAKREKTAKIDPALEEQFNAGRLLAVIASRPGRADGYLLEGKELEFYLKKIKNKKSK